jgi:hypothetical protein
MANIFNSIPEAVETEIEIEFVREYAEMEIDDKLARATYPRFGFTTAQVMENEEEYEAWLREVMEEEIASITVKGPASDLDENDALLDFAAADDAEAAQGTL